MRRAFLQMIWGLAFIAIDFKISNVVPGAPPIDLVLPDVVGYMLIYFALGSLKAVDANFRTARVFALLAAILSVPLMLTIPGTFGQLLGVAATALDVGMIWYTCTGIIHLADLRSNGPLSGFAATDRVLYAIAATLNLALIPFVSRPVPPFVVWPIVLSGFVVMLLVAVLFLRAADEAAA